MLFDYKVEAFTNLQTTLNTYIEGLLKTISTSHSSNNRFAKLHVAIILAEPSYKLTLDELKKFREHQFRYQFHLFNEKRFAGQYPTLKHSLYTEVWLENKTLLINDRDIGKKLKYSLENNKLDDFLKLTYLTLAVHHEY